jgi:hypothetical protein
MRAGSTKADAIRRWKRQREGQDADKLQIKAQNNLGFRRVWARKKETTTYNTATTELNEKYTE